MASKKLNFSANRLITGINIIDGMLFFTDGENEPKKINIEQFKNANHSSGSTVIYNREFLERDITVIKEHPVEAINTNLSEIRNVDINSESPFIKTIGSIIIDDKAKLLGEAVNGGTFFKKRGFYYLQSDTKPSVAELFSSGNNLNALNNGASFSAITPSLTIDKQYWFAAYGQTDIGVREEGEIKGFYLNASSISGLSVSTQNYELLKVSTIDDFDIGGNNFGDLQDFDPSSDNERLKFVGKVQNNGGGDISEVGFFYRAYNVLSNIATPTLSDSNNNEQSNVIKKRANNYDPSTGEFSIEITFNTIFSKIVYFQAYAENSSEAAQGGVLKYPDENLSLNPILPKPTVKTNPSATAQREPTRGILTGKIESNNGEKYISAGFIFSKNTSDKDELITNHSTDNRIYKQEVSLNPASPNDIFEFKTSSISTFSLTKSEPLFYLAYAENENGTNYGGVEPLPFSEPKDKSVIVTILQPGSEAFGKALKNSVLKNFINLKLDLNPDVPSDVTSKGWIVFRTVAGTPLTNSNGEKERLDAIKDLNFKGKTSFIKENDSANVGEFNEQFFGDGTTKIERGFDYHVVAVADIKVEVDDSEEEEAEFAGSNFYQRRIYGKVLTRRFAQTDVGGNIEYFKTLAGTAISSSSATFRGEVERLNSSLGITSVGFSEVGFAWSDNFTDLQGAVSSSVNHVQITTLSTLNTYLTTGTGNGEFKVDATGLPSSAGGTRIYFRAYYISSGSSDKIYAQEDDSNSAMTSGEDGISDVLLNNTPSLIKQTTLKVVPRVSSAAPINPQIIGELVNGGGLNNTLIQLSPVFYYMKESLIVGSTESAKKLYIIGQSNTSPNADSGVLSYNTGSGYNFLNGDDLNKIDFKFGIPTSILSSNPPALDPGIAYIIIMTTTSPGGTFDNGFGAGVTVSQLNKFTTGQLAISTVTSTPIVRVPKIGLVTTKQKTVNQVSAFATIQDNGGDGSFSQKGFYYIKSSEFTGSTPSQLVADSDKITTTGSLNRILTNLTIGAEYKVIAFAINSAGTGLSPKITTFTVKDNLDRYYINIKDRYNTEIGSKEYSSSGAPIDKFTFVYVDIGPTGDYTFSFSDWNTGSFQQPTATKHTNANGYSTLQIVVPSNKEYRDRTCTLTVVHRSNRAKKDTLRIKQSAASAISYQQWDDYFDNEFEAEDRY